MEYHDSRVKKLDDPLLTRARPTSWTARSFFLSLFKSFFFIAFPIFLVDDEMLASLRAQDRA